MLDNLRQPFETVADRRNMSLVPRLRMSVSTLIRNFGAHTATAGPQPQHVAATVQAHPHRGA